MPKSYPVEFRSRAIALVRAGKSITDTAQELGLGRACLYLWVNQDEIICCGYATNREELR